jgi:hypothetical protein
MRAEEEEEHTDARRRRRRRRRRRSKFDVGLVLVDSQQTPALRSQSTTFFSRSTTCCFTWMYSSTCGFSSSFDSVCSILFAGVQGQLHHDRRDMSRGMIFIR